METKIIEQNGQAIIVIENEIEDKEIQTGLAYTPVSLDCLEEFIMPFIGEIALNIE